MPSWKEFLKQNKGKGWNATKMSQEFQNLRQQQNEEEKKSAPGRKAPIKPRKVERLSPEILADKTVSLGWMINTCINPEDYIVGDEWTRSEIYNMVFVKIPEQERKEGEAEKDAQYWCYKRIDNGINQLWQVLKSTTFTKYLADGVTTKQYVKLLPANVLLEMNAVDVMKLDNRYPAFYNLEPSGVLHFRNDPIPQTIYKLQVAHLSSKLEDMIVTNRLSVAHLKADQTQFWKFQWLLEWIVAVRYYFQKMLTEGLTISMSLYLYQDSNTLRLAFSPYTITSVSQTNNNKEIAIQSEHYNQTTKDWFLSWLAEYDEKGCTIQEQPPASQATYCVINWRKHLKPGTVSVRTSINFDNRLETPMGLNIINNAPYLFEFNRNGPVQAKRASIVLHQKFEIIP